MYQGPHQRCWVHLLRDIHKLNEQYPQHQNLAEWSQQVREVSGQARAWPGPDPGLPDTVQRSRRVKQQQHYQQQLWSICHPYLAGDAPMRVLCQRVERFLPELFTFVAEPQSAADNNAAERSLRPPVVSRKISGGTRSPGKRYQEHPFFFGPAPARTQPGRDPDATKSILTSLFGTWRLQERNPYRALQSVLSKPLPAPL